MSRRPIILIPPTQRNHEEDIRLALNYTDSLVKAGATPLILPLTAEAAVYEQLFALGDGVLLTGGHDVDPARYENAMGARGSEGKELVAEITPLRDNVEYALLDYALAHDLPVFGICRGAQVLNCYFGGTLWYDLPAQFDPVTCGFWPSWGFGAEKGSADDTGADAPSDAALPEAFRVGDLTAKYAVLAHHKELPNGDHDGTLAHRAALEPGSRIAEILGCEHLMVNSLHHQSVRDVAPCLRAVAVAPDGVIEAVEHRELPNVLGVQWHPEYYGLEEPMNRYFSALVDAARASHSTSPAK